MAGARSNRRKNFFADHPKCCFCGGAVTATTEDHVPGRSLFLERLWPSGYVFPACVRCNNETSRDEALLAWLVRIRLSDFSPATEREFEKFTLELTRRFPEIWAGINLHSRVETRRLLREMNLPTSMPGVTDLVHSMNLPDQVKEASERYGAKLGKALHYRHTRKIVPTNAVINSKMFTNVNALGPSLPAQVFSFLTGEAEIQRASTSLKDQFDYRFAVVEEGEASAFVISFGESMVIVVGIFVDPARYEEAHAAERLSQQPTAVVSPVLPS